MSEPAKSPLTLATTSLKATTSTATASMSRAGVRHRREYELRRHAIVASQPDSGHARAFKAVVARLAEKIDGTLAASAAAAARIIVE